MRAENFVILRRKPVEGYDISFLITNFHGETMLKHKLVDFIIEFMQDVDKEISEMKLSLNARARIVAESYLSTTAKMLSETPRHNSTDASQLFQHFPNNMTPLPSHHHHHHAHFQPPPTRFSVSQFPNVQHTMINGQARPLQNQYPMYYINPATQFQVPQSAAIVGFPAPPPLAVQHANNTHFRGSYAFNPRFSDNGGAAGQRYENASTAPAAQPYAKVWSRPTFHQYPRRHRLNFTVPRQVQNDWPTYGIPSQFEPARPHIPRMPDMVARLVAACLASERAFASLAKFNVTCQAIHTISLPYLWRTVYWNWGASSEMRKRVVELGAWDVGYRGAKQWKGLRWDDKLQVAKGANHIHRSRWIPTKLAQTLKAGITYKIDATSASPASSVSGSSGNAATPEELEIYLCRGYKYGTRDVVALLDAIEPPSQDARQGDDGSPASSLSDVNNDNNDKECIKAREGFTRLVFLVDKTALHAAAVADEEEEGRWSSPTRETQLDQPVSASATATSVLRVRNYPWLRYIDLVICSAAEFNGDGDEKVLEVVLKEGLTALTSAVSDWYFDQEARPELVVKGVNLEQAKLCVEFVSEFIKEHQEFSCIVFKISSADILPSVFTTSTGSLGMDILQPMQTAYATLWSSPSLPARSIGSTHITSLAVLDQPDDMPPHISVEASVGVDGDIGAVKVEITEDGHVVWRDRTFCYLLASRMRSLWS
ncbi:hypothetical protein QFC21_005530 [Naganishia friedmannii]|uniref:Uncharacterized protein n=1 Tax=Naganishia friedmannii TaxID=89922 RepID=A0ACC2V9B2_9TREE|nr:hypothetical protein QFC21_005530 [Naganishia friedmannii]